MESNNYRESDQLIEFLCQTGKLKTLDRKGWTLSNRNISKPESVAGHMYRMAVMSMLFNNNSHTNDGNSDQQLSIDSNKLVRMSLIHDMAECIVGDITPFDGISAQQKHKLEDNAMNYLVSLLPQKSSQEFKSLFDEYESQQTIESQIVKELDRFDVMLQAFQYEKSEFEAKGRQIKFQEFFDNAIGKIKSKQLIDLSEALHRQRTQFWLNIESDKQSNKQ